MIASDTKVPIDDTRNKASFLFGLGFVMSYVLVSAAGEVYAASAFQTSDFYTTLLIAFVVITTAFNLLPQKRQGMLSPGRVTALLGLNITTSVAWLGLFIGLKFVEPAIIVSFMVALGPISAALANTLVRGIRPSSGDIMSSLLIAAIGAYLIAVTWTGHGGMMRNDGTWLGIAASVLAGMALAATSVFVKRLYDLGLEGRAILANRFYLTVLLLLFLVDYSELWNEITRNAPQALLIAISTLIVPILLIQEGIKRLEPITINVLLCTAPLVTFALQLFDNRLAPSIPTLIGNMLIVGVAIWTVRAHARLGK